MKSSRKSRSKPRPKPQPSPWAVALDAARNWASESLDPNAEGGDDLRWEYLDDVMKAVARESVVRVEPGDSSESALETGRHQGLEAGYLFGMAFAAVLRGPWDGLSLFPNRGVR